MQKKPTTRVINFHQIFDNNGELSSLYGMGNHHGSGITRHISDDDDESKSNDSYLNDFYKNDEKWTIDVFNANSKLIYVLNFELRGDERLHPHHVNTVVLT